MPPARRRPFRRRRAALRRMGAMARVRGSHRSFARRRLMPVKDEFVPFVVGRLAKSDRRMVVLEPETPSPIPGPWDLRAVFGL
ncbi:MAG TPA: hypothetical protein VEW03_05005 [Longimicrobiaceae bacterium]|nr:hypothetical protein [Longimicrobiaceae bacterium]